MVPTLLREQVDAFGRSSRLDDFRPIPPPDIHATTGKAAVHLRPDAVA